MTKIIHAAAIACILALSLMTSNGLSGTNYANAVPPHDDKPHPSPPNHKNGNICPSQSFLNDPHLAGATKILDITYVVQNDEDSGVGGTYWALDHFNSEHVKVWQLADGSFYALKTFDGIFVAPTGGPNPEDKTQTQTESAFGNIKGGYVATFTGTFTPGAHPTSGNIGTYNYLGTMTDILSGNYYGPPNTYDWLGTYFTSTNGFADFDQTNWGWSYTLDPKLQSSASMNQWCNYDSGNSGGILTQ